MNESRLEQVGWPIASALAFATLLAVPIAIDPDAGTLPSALVVKDAVLQLGGIAAFLAAALLGIATGRLRVAPRAYDLVVAAFLGLAAASAWWATNPGEVAKGTLTLASAAVVGVFARRAALEPAGARRVLGLLIAGGLIAAVVDSVHRFHYRGRVVLEGSDKFGSLLFPHDNTAALLFAPVVGAGLMLALFDRAQPRRRLVAALATAVLVAALLVLKSKAALIAAVLGPVALFVLLRAWHAGARLLARSRLAGIAAAACAIVLFTGLVLAPKHPAVSAFLKERFNQFVAWAGIDYGAAYMRPQIWKSTFTMFEERPLAGVGLRNFQIEFPKHDQNGNLKPHAHNQYLQTLAELGLPGLVLLALLFFVALLRAIATAAARDERRPIALAAACALLVIAIQALFETPLEWSFSALAFFVIAGVATGLATPGGRREIVLSGNGPAGAAVRYGLLPAVALLVAAVAVPASFAVPRQYELMKGAAGAAAAGDAETASALLGEAAEIGGLVEIHVQRAHLEKSLGRLDGALAEFDEAAALFPNNHRIHEQRGIVLLRLGRPDEALAALDRVQELFPGQAEVDLLRGEALFQLKRYDDAIDVLEAYRLKVAENAQTLLALGNAYYERSRRDLSLDDASRSRAAYARYLGVGALQGADWVKERIAQLGHWLNWKQVNAPPGPPPGS